MAGAGLTSGRNMGFNDLSKDAATWEQEKPGTELLTKGKPALCHMMPTQFSSTESAASCAKQSQEETK